MKRENKKTALVGLHEEFLARVAVKSAEKNGYIVKAVDNPESMIQMVRDEEYSVYLMDVNLGSPGSLDVGPGREVYNILKQSGRIDSGEANFFSVTNSLRTMNIAEEEGIPVYDSGGISFSRVIFKEEIK